MNDSITPGQVSLINDLHARLGLQDEIMPDTKFEAMTYIDTLLDVAPATPALLGLLYMLARDHGQDKLVNKVLPHRKAKTLVDMFMDMPPSDRVIERLTSLREEAGQASVLGRPVTTQLAYNMMKESRVRITRNKAMGILSEIAELDAATDDAPVNDATAYTDDDSVEAAPDSVMRTNGRAKGPKA